MHNLHFLLIRADSATDAASEADSLTLYWGDENNWRRVGGVASEDGAGDIENHQQGRWGLTFLDDADAISTHQTYFSRAVAFLQRRITEPITLPFAPHSTHLDPALALRELSDRLAVFDANQGNTNDLWAIGRNLKHVSELIDSRRAHEQGEEIPQLYDWRLDHFGLTDLTEESEGARRYLVFIDMHS
jgi:hypothetical protein